MSANQPVNKLHNKHGTVTQITGLIISTVYHQNTARAVINFKSDLTRPYFETGPILEPALIK
jgi:hypothetical protein